MNQNLTAYNFSNLGDVNPGGITSRMIALGEFVAASQNIISVQVNASFIRLENHSGHTFKCTFIDKYNQSFDLYVASFQIRTLNFPARLIATVNIMDCIAIPSGQLTPYVIMATEASGGNSDDAVMAPNIVGANITSWSSGHFDILAGPYPVDVFDFAIPQSVDDNTVVSGTLSNAASQSLNLLGPIAVAAIQYTAQPMVGSSLFHSLIVVNDSSTALTGIQVFAEAQGYTSGGDAVSFSVPQGIFVYPITFYGAKAQSTAAGQQLQGTMRRSGTWNAANNGIL